MVDRAASKQPMSVTKRDQHSLSQSPCDQVLSVKHGSVPAQVGSMPGSWTFRKKRGTAQIINYRFRILWGVASSIAITVITSKTRTHPNEVSYELV